MNRTDRLYALVEELRAVAPRPRSAGWLARRFEVSTRTIERDLDALRQAGVPLYAEAGRSGGYVLDKRHTLPPLALTPLEATALAVGLHALGDTPFGDAARGALHKVLAVMPGREVAAARELATRVLRLAPAAGSSPPVPPSVQNALTGRHLLRLHYLDRHGVVTERLVEPLGFLAGPSWYLIGWCRLRAALRGFRLDRIRHVERLDEIPPARQVDLTELDALGHELVGLDVMPNTDRTVSPAR